MHHPDVGAPYTWPHQTRDVLRCSEAHTSDRRPGYHFQEHCSALMWPCTGKIHANNQKHMEGCCPSMHECFTSWQCTRCLTLIWYQRMQVDSIHLIPCTILSKVSMRDSNHKEPKYVLGRRNWTLLLMTTCVDYSCS